MSRLSSRGGSAWVRRSTLDSGAAPATITAPCRTLGYDLRLGESSAAAATNTALNTAYAYGVGGVARAVRFHAPESATLTDAYFYCQAQTGSPGALTVELRGMKSANANTPDTAALATTTVTPGGAGQWFKATFASPYTLTAGAPYFVCIGDPAGSGSHCWTITMGGGMLDTDIQSRTVMPGSTTSDGWATNGSALAATPTPAVRIGGVVYGAVYTGTNTTSSNQLKRGLRIGPFPFDAEVCGLRLNTWTSVSGLSIFAEGDGPGDTPLHAISISADDITAAAKQFTPVWLLRDTVYRAVTTYSANSAAPGGLQSLDLTRYTELYDLLLFGGRCRGTIESGGAWADSYTQH